MLCERLRLGTGSVPRSVFGELHDGESCRNVTLRERSPYQLHPLARVAKGTKTLPVPAPAALLPGEQDFPYALALQKLAV